jgi:hypothetical protein
MKPHTMSEIRQGIRAALEKWGGVPDVFPVSQGTEAVMGVLLKYIPVEHFNRGDAESDLILVERKELEALRAFHAACGGRAPNPHGLSEAWVPG